MERLFYGGRLDAWGPRSTRSAGRLAARCSRLLHFAHAALRNVTTRRTENAHGNTLHLGAAVRSLLATMASTGSVGWVKRRRRRPPCRSTAAPARPEIAV